MATNTRLVWDAPLRAFHWLLALSILGSYITAEGDITLMPYHFWLGYWTIGLLIFRIIWGFVGPRHARFFSFVPTPGALIAYAKTLFDPNTRPAVGHNPIGALSVIALLAMVGFQAVTGLFTSDDIIWDGPYHGAVDSSTARGIGTLHRANFNYLLALIVLHVAAVGFYLVFKKQNLVRPMITGRKPADYVPENEAIAGSAWVRAMIAIAVAGAAVWIMLVLAPAPAADEFDYY